MDFYSLLALAISQITLGAGAWRLANQLRVRVDDHEGRIIRLETRKAA